jgi:hypothetical protein
MKAVRTPQSNVTLVLPGGTERNELPAQRIMVYNPELGETEKDAHPAIESVWQLTPDERRAIVGGAPVELIIRGDQHPPVSMNVGEPHVANLDQAIIDTGHAGRALAKLYAQLTDRLDVAAQDGEAEDVAWPPPDEFLNLWNEALEATRGTIAGANENGRPDADDA